MGHRDVVALAVTIPLAGQTPVSIARRMLMKPDDLQKHITSTYFALRLGIIVASLALPWVLYFGGNAGPHPGLQPSLSDYYPNGTEFTRD